GGGVPVSGAVRASSALMLLACASCGGSSGLAVGSPDANGADRGGATGADASDASEIADAAHAANDAMKARPPACPQALFPQCPASGACQYSADGGPPSRFCFANGTRIEETASGDCGGTFQVTSVVRKADGSSCYTEQIRETFSCESLSVTWTDSSGRSIA